jgi:hypothetical protein
VTSVEEKVAGMLIDLGVAANSVGDYTAAIQVTQAAKRLAHGPEFLRLCVSNLEIYRNNRARNLAPPGR